MSHGLISSTHWGPLRATVPGGRLSAYDPPAITTAHPQEDRS